MFQCVLKTAIDDNDKIQWQALYVDGKKVLENFEIDIEKALPIFTPGNIDYDVVDMRENEFSDIDNSFPSNEDFYYLLDYRDIEVGSKVWLEDGEWEVSEVVGGYRETGEYEYVDWKGLTPYKKMIRYSGHIITRFKVKGKNITFVWEDYNYQQSYLYEYLNCLK